MDVILDEARNRGMKVWILDDSHFPTGFANGAAIGAPAHVRRQSVYCHTFPIKRGKTEWKCNLKKVMADIPKSGIGKMMDGRMDNGMKKILFDDDRLLSIAVKVAGEILPRSVEGTQVNDTLRVNLPVGTEKVYVTFLTRNAGIHRSYINMLEEDGTKLLLDTVYEPHWQHYQADFGKTIAGFFSDEPEIGNGYYFCNEITVGKNNDLPWSDTLERYLPEVMGERWKELLPLLWDNDLDAAWAASCEGVFIDALPDGVCDGRELPEEVKRAKTLPLNRILEEVSVDASLNPAAWRMRCYHYRGAEELYYFVNEDDKAYEGTVTIPRIAGCYAYDAWENRIVKQELRTQEEQTELSVFLRAGESRIVIVWREDQTEDAAKEHQEKLALAREELRPAVGTVFTGPLVSEKNVETLGTPSAAEERVFGEKRLRKKVPLTGGWKLSVCKSVEYPNFGQEKELSSFGDYGKINRRFSGYIAYRAKLPRLSELGLAENGCGRAILEITDAGEDVEVFVNGKSAGIQVLPPFWFDITELLTEETNELRIEVATALERERGANKKHWQPIGILGEVNLYLEQTSDFS